MLKSNNLAFSCFMLVCIFFSQSELARGAQVCYPQKEDWNSIIKKKLEKKVSFEFLETPFDKIIEFLRDFANVNVVNCTKDRGSTIPVTLEVADMPLEQALAWICRSAGSEMKIENGALFIIETGKKLQLVEPVSVQLAVALSGGVEAQWKVDILQKLIHPTSFDFSETPLLEGIKCLSTFSRVNLIIDPKIIQDVKNAPITLKVDNASVGDALSWLCLMAEAQWELKDNAVNVFVSEEMIAGRELNSITDNLHQSIAAGNAKIAHESQNNSTLRVKLANGNELEADDAMLQRTPGLADELLEQFIDPAKDGLLTYRVSKELAEKQLDAVKKLIAIVAPNVNVDYDTQLELLLILGDDPSKLRRAASCLRALGIHRNKLATQNRPDLPQDFNRWKTNMFGEDSENAVKGQVLAVKPETGLLMISMGSQQGMKMGCQLKISRKGKYIGMAQVEKVYPDMCSAKVLEKNDSPQVNDDVSRPLSQKQDPQQNEKQNPKKDSEF